MTDALSNALEQEKEAEALWQLAPLAAREDVARLARRLEQAQDLEALNVAVALGFTRQARALRTLYEVDTSSQTSRLGRALGLLALGNASQTGTIAASFGSPSVSLRYTVASALARMPASRPRAMSADLLDDRDAGVRLVIARSHLRRGSRKARDVLQELALTATSTLAAEAGRALLGLRHRFEPATWTKLPRSIRAWAVRVALRNHSSKPFLEHKDLEIRAGALASALVAEAGARDLDRVLKRRARRGPIGRGEAEMARVLSGRAGEESVLTELEAPGIRGAVAVLSAYAVRGAQYLGETAVEAIAAALGDWSAASAIGPEDEARALQALSRIDTLRALPLARERLDRSEAVVVLSSVEALGRSGRSGDAAALLGRAETSRGRVRVKALRAAREVCAR